MNRLNVARLAAAVAGGLAVTVLAACSSSGTTSSSPSKSSSASVSTSSASGQRVKLVWWHDGDTEPLKSYWAGVAKGFEAIHPNVTIEVDAFRSEDLQNTRIPNALRGSNPPDLFQQWGGGREADQAAAGKLLDITTRAAGTIASLGGAVGGWTVGGKVYGLPWDMAIEGFWYNKALFAQAGITGTPATFTDLETDIAKLRAIGVAPISLGAKDQWPAAHYWFNFALRDCTTAIMQQAAVDKTFTDPCFAQAGTDLQAFLKTNPFQSGFLGTTAQQGASSSAGLLATGKAAMELMGAWEPSAVGGLTADKKIPSFLAWFPFPTTTGGKGDPTSAMGGGGGFSCSYTAPPECVELLQYIDSEKVQEGLAAIGAGIPALPSAASALTDPNLKAVAAAQANVKYVQLWLDVAYGSNVGGALNQSVTNLMAGQGDAGSIVTAITQAAAQG
ncbi:extracellular solute-binding protein [Gryllotalpicola sp.]|uniref:extracellular solute-binding protein n=1 Tax=Gryllotalpicola sp. TaxID=1932787 RepID=UPI002628ABD3|nr:extracellular solute-binding protein [Gryllotalpicola sp.]